MKKKNHVRKSQVFILLALFLALAISTPYFIRYVKYNGLMIGSKPYYHARIADEIVKEGIPSTDNFAFGGREYIMEPYHIILAGFSYLFGADFASKIVPALAGIFSLALFYLILKSLKFGLLERISASVVLVMSPVFIYTSSVSTSVSVMILLDLLGFYIYLKGGRWSVLLSSLILFAASIFSFSNLLFILAVLLCYSMVMEEDRRRLSMVTLFMVLSLLFYYIPFYFRHGFPASFALEESNIIQLFVSDMGGLLGFSVFTLLLAGLGLAVVWKRKKEFYFAYMLMIFIIAYSIFFNYASVYSNFFIAMLAGIAFANFARIKWQLRQIRNLSLLLLFCGVLFSAVSYSIRLGNMQPDQDLVEALLWLKERSSDDDVVFSHYSKGFWIERYAQRAVLMDGLLEYSGNAAEYLNDSMTIFNTFDIRETRMILEKHNARFVLMTPDMDQGLVWSKPGQGLAFLLKNSETFKKIYGNQGAAIYEYVYMGEE